MDDPNTAWISAAIADLRLGRYHHAAGYLQRAMGLFHEMGHASSEAECLISLGEVHLGLCRYEHATGNFAGGQFGGGGAVRAAGGPGDQAKAVALAKLLLARASGDPGFERALREWWDQAGPVREKTGDVTNTVSGGTQYGPVLQGRDFTGLTFGAPPAVPPSRPGDAG